MDYFLILLALSWSICMIISDSKSYLRSLNLGIVYLRIMRKWNPIGECVNISVVLNIQKKNGIKTHWEMFIVALWHSHKCINSQFCKWIWLLYVHLCGFYYVVLLAFFKSYKNKGIALHCALLKIYCFFIEIYIYSNQYVHSTNFNLTNFHLA